MRPIFSTRRIMSVLQIRDGANPLLPSHEELYTDPFDINEPRDSEYGHPLPQDTKKCQKNSLRLLFGITTITALAIRILDLSQYANIFACLTAGIAFQATVETGLKNKDLAQVQRITKTLFSQTTVYYLSKMDVMGETYQVTSLQRASISAVIALHGANLEASLRGLWQFSKLKVRIESSHATPHKESTLLPQESKVYQYTTLALKTLATGGLAALSLLAEDPIAKGLASFAAAMYGGQIAGLALSIAFNRYIQKADEYDQLNPHAKPGTHLRAIKTGANTLAFLTIPLILVLPWGPQVETLGRLSWFPIMGAITGLCDEFLHKNQRDRFTKIPLSQLSELDILNPPGQTQQQRDGGPTPLRLKIYKTWRIAYPTLAILGLLANLSYENFYYFSTLTPKLQVGALVTGFCATFLYANIIDAKWSKQPTNRIPNRLMASLLSTRILGIDPLYFYLAGVNAISINTNSIDEQNTLAKTISIFTWFAYSASMSLELWRMWGRRRGTAVSTFPRMVIINTSMTLRAAFSNLIPC